MRERRLSSPDRPLSEDLGSQAPDDGCADLLKTLFPRPVGAASARLGDAIHPLFPGEEVFVANAVHKRRREFAVGRFCARRALLQIGFAPIAIPSAPDRSPIWPAGAVGSISHDASLCVAVAAKGCDFRSIGVDIERIGAVSGELADMVLRPDERFGPAEQQAGDADWLTLHFCLKEAAYKAFYPLCRQIIDFQAMRIGLAPAQGHFEASTTIPGAPSFAGRYALSGGQIFAVAW